VTTTPLPRSHSQPVSKVILIACLLQLAGISWSPAALLSVGTCSRAQNDGPRSSRLQASGLGHTTPIHPLATKHKQLRCAGI
jgi:hypothetical protein